MRDTAQPRPGNATFTINDLPHNPQRPQSMRRQPITQTSRRCLRSNHRDSAQASTRPTGPQRSFVAVPALRRRRGRPESRCECGLRRPGPPSSGSASRSTIGLPETNAGLANSRYGYAERRMLDYFGLHPDRDEVASYLRHARRMSHVSAERVRRAA